MGRQMQYTAVESARQLKVAVNHLSEMIDYLQDCANGTSEMKLRHAGLVGWAERGNAKFADRYHIGFTRATRRGGPIVQMATMVKGYNRRLTGLVAVDDQGRNWLMHKGRLHVALSDWTPATLIKQRSGQEPVPVRFSDGKERSYYAVAEIDAVNASMAHAIDRYVQVCERIRRPYDDEDDMDLPSEDGAQLPDDDGLDDVPDDPDIGDSPENGRQRPGPRPGGRFGNRPPRVDQAHLPADCYVFRYENTTTWKIGWALYAKRRLRTVKAHIPLHLHPQSWRLYAKVRFPTANQAYDMEQRLLTEISAERGPWREQVICPIKTIHTAVATMEAAAANAQAAALRNARPPAGA